jgi:trigger factor
MKVVLEELAQPYLIRIIEDNKDAITERLDQVWNTKKNSIVLDGFRKGHVPQNIAEKSYGFQTLYKEYIDEVVSTAIARINAENNVTVIDLQQVIPEKLDKQGIVMQAVAYLKPSVASLDYSNVEIVRLDSEVTEQEVNMQLMQLQEQNATLVPIVDRPVAYGDLIVISYVGSMGGVPFPGGTATRQQVPFTSTSFIAGFGEAVVGMTPGESKEFNVTFPTEYHAKNLAGKEATFDLTVHEIKVKSLPSLDDEFAVTCGFSSFEELNNKTRGDIQTKKLAYNKSKMETEICLELLQRAKMSPIPQTMIQRRLTNLLQQELNTYGITEQEYLKQRNLDKNDFERAYYQVALRDIKIQLILDYIATAEDLQITEEEQAQYLKEESERLGYTIDQISTMVTTEQLTSQVKLRKAYDYLLTNARYVDGPAT